LKVLWAPWRAKYVSTFINEEKKGCIFCEMLNNGKSDRENLILYRGKHSFVVLNRFPYTSGHFMIVPYRHVPSFEDLSEDERMELMEVLSISIKALRISYRPDGINVGMNLGRAAGAGIEEHMHIHVVPRWVGDTNFMGVIGEVRVISDSLDSSFEKLKKAFEEATAN
jgi:ATP adenylyltransferase